MERAIHLIAVGWLIVAANYVTWALAIGRMILSGTQFTVDGWTLATPFVILMLAPVGTLLTWRNRDSVGRMLLFFVAVNWLLWATIRAGILREFLWAPTLLKTILFLSVLTVAVIVVEGLKSYRAARHGSA